MSDQTSRGYLDPDGVNISGARAVVRLLEGQGVEVTPVRTVADAVEASEDGGTLLVTEPDRLLPEQIDRLTATGADIVLVQPSRPDQFSADVVVAGQGAESVLEPGCDLPAAQRAGSASLGGIRYEGPAEATGCYLVGDTATLLSGTHRGGGQLVALGSSAPLTNRHLDEDGNAALALGLLGAREQLTWYQPSFETSAAEERSFIELLPGWVGPVAWQLVIAALIAAWWRARRLGPVVTEPLPVVVRAAETTEGRARLYRRGRSRGHAAAVLRQAAQRRLAHRFGLPASASAVAVAEAVSRRTTIDTAAVADMLDGPEPTDDAGLVRLADALDALELEVR
nr:DUF4350 domain-containing protein [Phytoactinopolyspora alkaliphila]